MSIKKENNKNKTESKLRKIHREEEEKKAKQKASKLGIPYLDLSVTPINPSGLKVIPLEKAKKTKMCVIQKFGRSLKLAVNDPENKQTKKALKDLKDKGFSYKIFLVSESSLETAWNRFKHEAEQRKEITKQVEITSERLKEFQKEIGTFKDIRNKFESISRMSTTEIVEIVLAGALKTEASDVHFEAEEKEIRLRFRIDGILQDVVEIPTSLYSHLLSRIKVLSELKINVHDTPQDGRFSIVIDEQEIEIRTSIIPSAYGENIVLRILNPNTIGLELEDLGLEKYALEIISKQLKKPHGMIVNTGPTGSGKTTTLYAFVKRVNNPKIKIITLENPIEYHLEGIEQTQIRPDKKYTFASGLRALLRQDPDVILLGEIRDNETAETAIHAALTGHLVFTTLHTNDAAGAIPRLIDMKVNAKLIPSALNLVIAQRLVRRVCTNCAQKYKPKPEEIKRLKQTLKTVPKNIRSKYPKLNNNLTLLKAGKGCKKCNFTGYKGRIGVIELFVIDEEMEKIIIKAPSITEIKQAAIEQGMVTIKQDAAFKILNKVTTLEEVERILGILQ